METYFAELLNEENPREPLEKICPVEGLEREITRSEIEIAIKSMKTNKAPGPSGMIAETFKALDHTGIDYLYIILNDFMRQERLPQYLKESELLALYKQKSDVMECGNYRVIKLLEVGLKVYEKVIEKRIRDNVQLHDIQFVFRPGRGTMDAVIMLRQVQEKTLEGNGKRYWTFVDMEKAVDRVPREVVYLSLRKKGVSEKIVRPVRSMYVDAKTAVTIGTGNTGGFEIRVGVHQGSCLSPLLFIIVMDAVLEHVDREVPWNMLYADDLAL